MRTRISKDNMELSSWTLLMRLFVILLFISSNQSNANPTKIDVDNTMDIPPDQEGCSCSWSQWMDTGEATASGEDETFGTLRSAGYNFCQDPVDIQCFGKDANALIDPAESTLYICDVNTGGRCNFLCDDLAVRVACCYCPPDAIGPEFLISSRSPTGGCLKAMPTNSSSDFPQVSIAADCNFDDPTQSWAWVSTKSIKNVATSQCLAFVNNTVTVQNCNDDAKQQKWKYIDKTATLQVDGTPRSYLKKSGNSTIMASSKDEESQWLAKVMEGETSLKKMRSAKCDELSEPENGEKNCTLGEYLSSKCSFSCNHGYRLPEDFENPSECTDDGFFSEDTPVCEKIECMPAVDTIENGLVTCSKENTLDSLCKFQCNEGYALVGSQEVTCTSEGSWSSRFPICERVMCSPDFEKEVFNDGTVNCSNSVYYGSICHFTCLQGFELIGDETRTCQMNAKWDHSTPSCSKIVCQAIIASENSAMSCTDGNDYLSTCTFSCDVGYDMVGSPTAVCNADKAWSSEPPACTRKTCNALSPPDNGDMFCDDDSYYDSKCSFTCDRGFRLDGEESLKCTAEGWNFGVPTCKQITCSRVSNVVNGEFNCTNGEIFDSKCTFTCARGYKIVGEESMQCTDSDWSTTAPICEQISCPAIPKPKNGKLLCSAGNKFSSSCYLICDPGYITPNRYLSKPIDCRLDGTWSVDIENLHCNKFSCRTIKISKGVITCTDHWDFNSTCHFQCRDGFNLLGANQATCTMNGWDAQAPTCSRKTCSPPLARPSNGQINCVTTGAPVCTFSCDKGYELKGESVSECQANERWSVEEIPICEIVTCPTDPTIPSHSNMTCSGDTYLSVCKFRCEIGYELNGKESTVCTEARVWDAEPPTCQKISCPNLENPKFGKMICSENFDYKSKCDFSCDEGYRLQGNAQLQCNHNASWNKSPPYCERITCKTSFSNPSNGRVQCTDDNNYDSVCTFVCEEGFFLDGSSESACKETDWTVPDPPMCKPITCPLDHEGIPNGARGCDRSNSYKSMCTYSCNDGYTLVGSMTSNCTGEGTWSNDPPKCTEILCPEIMAPENGRLKCTKANMYGSQCSFECAGGFVRTSEINSAKCMENRRWNPAGFRPVCNAMNSTILPLKSSTIITTPPTTTTTLKTTTTESTTTSTTTSSTTTSTSTSLSPTTTTPTTTELTLEASSSIPPFKPPIDQVATTTEPIPPKVMSTSKPDVVDQPTTLNGRDNASNATSAGGFPMMIVIIIGVVVALLVVVVIILLVWRKKSAKKKNYNGADAPYKNDNRYDLTEFGPLIPNGTNTGPKKFGSISMDRLEMEYNRRHADDDKMFREEFHSLVDGSGTKEAGGRAKNKDKNRYTNILPYDHSRVILPKIGMDQDSDYINASFVDGYKHKGKFIAAQGPKENTIVDFWRMIWEQNVSTVIMATNLEERKELKCAKYWPAEEGQTYGDLVVHMTGENHLVDYTIRQFTVQRVPNEMDASLTQKRTITQYHFTSWPDFGVPKSPSGILKFLRKIKHTSPTGYGSMVVHCSAGVGRTGTFICIDAMMDMIARENKIDVFSFCSQLRQQRPEMVQTEQQYIFIYQAILEHHLYGDTEVEASEVSAHIEDLMQRLPGNVTGMEHEFKKLTSIRIQKEHMRAGNHPANMRKNRVLLIFPYDWNRVMLSIKRGQENTDYINASYIDGYRQKDAYIATQGPLPHTTEDFWRMIWQYECASIVMLTELVERGQSKCAQYWPNEGVSTFGDIDVELASTYDADNYTERDFKVTNISSTDRKQLIVKQFHYHGWPEVGAPTSGYSMIELVEAVQRQQQNSGNHPIVVHCSAGGGRTGAFCALSTALEQVKAEGVLDMFQIVKCLRMQRPHMVQDLEQYEFCYRAVQEYVDSMSEYYNFK